MAIYTDTIVDQNGLPLTDVQVAVLDAVGDLVALSAPSGGPINNPVPADSTGTVSFGVTDGIYTLRYYEGGRIVRNDYNLGIGSLTQGPFTTIVALNAAYTQLSQQVADLSPNLGSPVWAA